MELRSDWHLLGMSMYEQLLAMALDETSDAEDDLTAGEALVQLLLCRTQLRQSTEDPDKSSGAASALGEELDYDVALLKLARLLGIEIDVQAFSQPSLERSRLEEAIEAHGAPIT